MADEALFLLLHNEMVSGVYKSAEQGEVVSAATGPGDPIAVTLFAFPSVLSFIPCPIATQRLAMCRPAGLPAGILSPGTCQLSSVVYPLLFSIFYCLVLFFCPFPYLCPAGRRFSYC